MNDEIWSRRAQSLLNIIRDTMHDAIPNSVTPTGVIGLMHADDVPAHVKVQLREFFALTPGFQEGASSQGLYHYTFLQQLEHLCDGFKDAYECATIT